MSSIEDAAASGTGFFTTLAKITARDGTAIRAALYPLPITFESEVYDATHFVPSTLQSQTGMEVDNASIKHLLGTVLTRANLVGGKWGGARLEIIQIDYRHPEWGALRRVPGRVGEVGLSGFEADTQFRGLVDLLGQPIGDRISAGCRHKFGDAGCTVTVASFTRTGTVSAITNRQRFTVSFTSGSPATAVDDYYKSGKILWTSGPNSSLSMETTGNVGNLIKLFQPMLSDVAVGHAFSLIAGDDKTLTTCFSKFNNAVNFGGEPDSPTREQVYSIPS